MIPMLLGLTLQMHVPEVVCAHHDSAGEVDQTVDVVTRDHTDDGEGQHAGNADENGLGLAAEERNEEEQHEQRLDSHTHGEDAGPGGPSASSSQPADRNKRQHHDQTDVVELDRAAIEARAQ